MGESQVDRGALIGAAIAAVAGIAWTWWGASGLSGALAVAVRVAGTVVGLALLISLGFLARSPGGNGRGTFFGSRVFRFIVLGEVAALFGGGILLNSTGNNSYVSAWYAFVVGVHFVLFGVYFWAGFAWLGAVLVAAATAGTVVGFAGGGGDDVVATAGLTSAVALFTAGGYTLSRARA